MNGLIPRPNGALSVGGGWFSAAALGGVHRGDFPEWTLRAFCQRAGLQLEDAPAEAARLSMELDEGMGAEAYSLQVDEGGVRLVSAQTAPRQS